MQRAVSKRNRLPRARSSGSAVLKRNRLPRGVHDARLAESNVWPLVWYQGHRLEAGRSLIARFGTVQVGLAPKIYCSVWHRADLVWHQVHRLGLAPALRGLAPLCVRLVWHQRNRRKPVVRVQPGVWPGGLIGSWIFRLLCFGAPRFSVDHRWISPPLNFTSRRSKLSVEV